MAVATGISALARYIAYSDEPESVELAEPNEPNEAYFEEQSRIDNEATTVGDEHYVEPD